MRLSWRPRFALVLCTLACVAFASPVRALLIDFEDSIPATSTFATSSHGFDFAGSTPFSVGPGVASHCLNGTRLLCDQFGNVSVITMTQTGGGAFNLLGAGLQEGINVPSAAAQIIRVTGFFSGGGSIVADLDLDDDWTTFQTFPLVGFSSLSSASFVPLGGRQFMGMDNIEVAAVPEPQSVLLLALGVAGLAVARRRLQANPSL